MKDKFDHEWIDSLPISEGVLKNSQKQAKKLLIENGFPTKKIEEWRFTNLNRLSEILKLPVQLNNNKINLAATSHSKGGSYQLFINCKEKLKSNNLPKNIKLMNDNEIQQYLSKSDQTKNDFILNLNSAINNSIIGLKVSGKELTSIEIILSSKEKELIPSKIILIVEKDSKLDLLEILEGSEFTAYSHVIDIYIEENSTVNHGVLAIGRGHSKLLAKIVVNQEEKSNYSLSCFQEGWNLSHIEKSIIQLNGNAVTKINGLQICEEDQELATFSIMNFNGPNGCLEQNQKSILNNKSHSIFNGLINVPKIAQNTDASQLNKNLLLSPQSKVDTSPKLKIIADNVQCKHGATVSKLEEEQLFYLQSRGINSNKASQLMMKGFCKDILAYLPLQAVNWSHLSGYLDYLKK
ncbi:MULTISPECIES: Fe-S cluster assembly protein SufD [unclassified Prochlorococcus]|uniref:Fe-S cluster assembly protein SufD n=1 Tax=unclassified Prochlorococcus TaxID=2627481 RepID=UPI000533921D|nr:MULTISPECIES: Fe-S cluster assembly protein SufD [unclassified Prochlorococcus]KGG16870.1 Iron-sulfur cluster assembly protein SufD [Prochlorococcus sp. MIT 0602]KGG18156.1 Iron-sulfur cluster assembly protein SufD [Prochlorococcus sp. MIT 0603]